ncbi:MAG: hypothetical protein AB1505_11885 [Candidatus Latescibacterota bacterium]
MAIVWLIALLAALGPGPRPAAAQAGEPLLGFRQGGALHPTFEMEYVVPEVHKYYAPAHLLESYTRPWYAVETRYAQTPYRRYLDRLLEGYDAYDALGTPLGRGWLVYSWTQQQPQVRGSDIVKRPVLAARNRIDAGYARAAYEEFFQSLVIAGDESGGGQYRLMVGDAIATRFTPLTFAKPRFNGVRLDCAADWYEASLLLSRPSDPDGFPPQGVAPAPGAGQRTNLTHLLGGHLGLPLADRARLGFTYVNAHNALTEIPLDSGNPLRGTVTTVQNQPLKRVWVRLRDDSPEDGTGGAVLLDHEIVLVDTAGRRVRGRELGLVPRVEGRTTEGGVLAANGNETILLEYDLGGLDTLGFTSGTLRQASVDLTVANDFLVEVASDLQTDLAGREAAVVFLPVARAARNVQDRSNTRVLRADYGLPVANEVLGVDWDLVEWGGFSLQGEVAVNQRFSRYPNPSLRRQHQSMQRAAALYANGAYQRGGWLLFGEGFSIADDYQTRYWLTANNGVIRYAAPVPELYEFVEDDDDQDGVPEWSRPFQVARRDVWPGYDENGDFINDLNQNANRVPDSEEPFLRFRSDPPEFLFGLDMNHNGWIDRLENDQRADLPYRPDHRGYNAYLRARPLPDLSLTLGRQRMRLVRGDGRTRAWYGLATYTRLVGRQGQARLGAYGARVQDDIPDDLEQWFQPVEAQGRMREVEDLLPGRDTWRGTLYADLEQRPTPGLRLQHRFNADGWRQREPRARLEAFGLRRRAGFVGLVDRAEWSVLVGQTRLEPRWKSQVRWERPWEAGRTPSASVAQTAILMVSQPLLSEGSRVSYFARYGRQVFATEVQLGLEAHRLWLLEGVASEAEEDYLRQTGIGQLTNRVAFQGYRLVTAAGLLYSQWRFPDQRRQTNSTFYLTMTAGLQ